MTDLIESTLRGLSGQLGSQVSRPGDDRYLAATEIWAKPIGRMPRTVVHCRTLQDIQLAIAAARSAGLSLSVRGGGHDWAGRALCDGLVIDLSGMRDVIISRDRRSARILGGARASDVLAATDPLGLAAVTGSCSAVGMAGLTLGGGYGPLIGRFGLALDNLIAQGKAKPMIVVMPLGYGTMDFLRLAWDAWNHTELRDANFKKFTDALLTEVMPRVEGEYRVTKDRNARAIAGLSMGGSESLLTGLNHLDTFSWIGAFSSGGIPEDFEKDFPALDAKANQQLHLLWIACGTEDHLITVNRNLREWLKTKGVNHTDIETPGMHTWMVWRRNLAEFAQLIFSLR